MSTTTTQPAIDIYNYPENASPLELARYQVAVMEAAERGEPVEIQVTPSKWDESSAPCWIWKFYNYRIARPKIAEGHNPDKLTEDQVGVKDGWRLLTDAEHAAVAQAPATEWWCGKRWHEPGCVFWNTNERELRTKNPPGHYLPKPAPTKKLVPWTFDTAPKGHLILRDKTEVKRIYVASFFDENGITAGYHREWSVLLSAFEHSTDNGVTWLPCGTEVSA